jgi:hypothetical protein
MSSELRAQVKETHSELFDAVQSEFGEILSAVQATELELVKHCQGLHDRVCSHVSERHEKLAGRGDPDFIRSLDDQGEELVRIVQTRFAELTRDLKSCHGGACRTLNRRGFDQVLEMSRQQG